MEERQPWIWQADPRPQLQAPESSQASCQPAPRWRGPLPPPCTRITMHCLSGSPGSLSSFPARFLAICSSGVQRFVEIIVLSVFTVKLGRWHARRLVLATKSKVQRQAKFLQAKQSLPAFLFHLWRLLDGNVTCHSSVDQDWNAVGHS